MSSPAWPSPSISDPGAAARLEQVQQQLVQPAQQSGGDGGVPAPRFATATNPELSRLLFTQFGLDQFPDFLSRWHTSDILALEQTLAGQLAAVQSKRRAIQETRQLLQRYRPRFITRTEWSTAECLAPVLARVVQLPGGIRRNPAAFLRLLAEVDEEGFVHSFPCL